MAALPANTLIAAAMGQSYDTLSDRGIKECILYAVGTNGGGGGGGGSGSVTQGEGPPVSPPASPLDPAVYTDTLTTFIYTWFVENQTWIISSTSGGNPLSQGHGVPTDPPTDPTVPSGYVDLDHYVFYTWNVGEQAWH